MKNTRQGLPETDPLNANNIVKAMAERLKRKGYDPAWVDRSIKNLYGQNALK